MDAVNRIEFISEDRSCTTKILCGCIRMHMQVSAKLDSHRKNSEHWVRYTHTHTHTHMQLFETEIIFFV